MFYRSSCVRDFSAWCFEISLSDINGPEDAFVSTGGGPDTAA